MNYYISDLHFGHKNIIKFDGRPFESAEEMDAKIIENWNNVVKNNDNVYIVGDMFWCKMDRAIETGRKFLGCEISEEYCKIIKNRLDCENMLNI